MTEIQGSLIVLGVGFAYGGEMCEMVILVADSHLKIHFILFNL